MGMKKPVMNTSNMKGPNIKSNMGNGNKTIPVPSALMMHNHEVIARELSKVHPMNDPKNGSEC